MSNNVVTVKVQGLEGVAQKLKDLGPKLGRRAPRKALNAVGDFWVPEVQSRTPSVDDALKNSIIKKVSTRKVDEDDLAGTVTVGPNMRAPRADSKKSLGPGIYATWVEFGLKRKKYKAHPFMRPTFDVTKEKAVTVFVESLQSELNALLKERNTELHLFSRLELRDEQACLQEQNHVHPLLLQRANQRWSRALSEA